MNDVRLETLNSHGLLGADAITALAAYDREPRGQHGADSIRVAAILNKHGEGVGVCG
jgi:hypothetical protein